MTSQPLGAAPADGPRLALTQRVKRLRELKKTSGETICSYGKRSGICEKRMPGQ